MVNQTQEHNCEVDEVDLMLALKPDTLVKRGMKVEKCVRCGISFESNPIISGDDVCRTCSTMNCITFWYPRLFRLGFPMPKTIILHTNLPLEMLTDGRVPEGIDEFINGIRFAAPKLGTYPLFLRTGYLSNKHDWKNSCFLSKETLANKEWILKHITNIVELSAIATIDRMMPIDFWAVREFIETKSYFDYFPGEMPITKERRYFVRDGMIECHHNYWDREAFEDDIDEEKFNDLSSLSKEDESELNKMARYVANLFSGFWSVDFLKGKNDKWYLTDMAIGESSHHQKHK